MGAAYLNNILAHNHTAFGQVILETLGFLPLQQRQKSQADAQVLWLIVQCVDLAETRRVLR